MRSTRFMSIAVYCVDNVYPSIVEYWKAQAQSNLPFISNAIVLATYLKALESEDFRIEDLARTELDKVE